jgi:hypothetical protein
MLRRSAVSAPTFVRLAEMNVRNMTMNTASDVLMPVSPAQGHADLWQARAGK